MRLKTLLAGASIAALVLLALLAGRRAVRRAAPDAASAVTNPPQELSAGSEALHRGFLHGRVTTDAGITYEGRLRFGGDQEASWGDTFNGSRDQTPWAAHAPANRPDPLRVFGLEFPRRERPIRLVRPFMARLGDIARIEGRGLEVIVTLKSGTTFHLERLDASDFDDGVRVWDERQGVVDLTSSQIRDIELLPTPRLRGVPERLHGVVRTSGGDFTGFVQWDLQDCVGADEIVGRAAEGDVRLRFDAVRSLARRPPDGVVATLRDGRALVLEGGREVGRGNRGIAVEDMRFGRVLIPWDAFESLELDPGGSGPGYDDFPPGSPLAGSLATRDGRRLAGRLVHDLDESETTETLDAPAHGVSYSIPLGLVASIVVPGDDERHATVVLHGGRELRLERSGDLGDAHAGMLVFVQGRERPEYVPWADVERIDLERPAAMYPAIGKSPG